MKKLILLFFCSICLFSCSTIKTASTPEQFLNNFQSFINQADRRYDSSYAIWEKIEEGYKFYTEEEYKRFSSQMNGIEKTQYNALKAKYGTIKIKRSAAKVKEGLDKIL